MVMLFLAVVVFLLVYKGLVGGRTNLSRSSLHDLPRGLRRIAMRKLKGHTQRLRMMWVVCGIGFGISGQFTSFGSKQSEVEIVKQRSASSIKFFYYMGRDKDEKRHSSAVERTLQQSKIYRRVLATVPLGVPLGSADVTIDRSTGASTQLVVRSMTWLETTVEAYF